ncbi:MAG TPA: ABC transporter permease, partial [Synergistaceae bacterium]|nr:ABC transporter permease [Synergistaceae bacterium]
MDHILSATFLTGLLAAMMRMATPIIFGTLGEILSERAGVLNLGIEGIMLMGAMSGFLTTLHTGSLWLGVAAAALSGVLLALLMALLTVTLGLSQHVSGLGITLFSTGLAMFIYRLSVGSPVNPPTVTPFTQVALPALSSIPILGEAFFTQYALVYVAFLLIPVLWVLLYRTTWGLAIRTVGENPFAADTVGISVPLVRTLCLAAGGALMGVGGAFLTLAHQNMFLIDVVGGRGWISIAMVIFGNWDPVRGAAGALIFGLLDAFQLRLQALGVDLPFHLFLALPYV